MVADVFFFRILCGWAVNPKSKSTCLCCDSSWRGVLNQIRPYMPKKATYCNTQSLHACQTSYLSAYLSSLHKTQVAECACAYMWSKRPRKGLKYIRSVNIVWDRHCWWDEERGEKTSFFTSLQIVIQLAFYLNNISGIKVFNVAIIEIKIVLSQTHK